MVMTLPGMAVISAGETEVISIDYQSHLDTAEFLTSTPIITEQTTTDLTLLSKTVSTTALTINGKSVAIGEAVQFTITGQQAKKTYRIRVAVPTDATPTRTLVRDILVRCVA